MSKMDRRPYIVRDILAAWHIPELRAHALRVAGWRLARYLLWVVVGPALLVLAAMSALAEKIGDGLGQAVQSMSPFPWVGARLEASIGAAHQIMSANEIRARIGRKVEEE